MQNKVWKKGIIFSMLAFITGCATGPHIQVADVNAKPVSVFKISCKSPFKLTQNCSGFSGPTKSIAIDGFKFKVSGNESGTITLMYNSILGPNAVKSNRNYELMKREILSHGIEIVSVIPLLNQNKIQGYAISTKEPSYQIWDQFATKKK